MSSATRETGQDVIAFLEGQHHEVKRLFGEIRQLRGGARQGFFEDLVRLLAVHETAEEIVVYPAVRDNLPNGDELADARLQEEDEAKTALAELEDLGTESPEFDAKFAVFESMVVKHAEAEEHQVFAALRQVLPPDDLRKMGEKAERAEKTAPTHPHPKGPESAVGNRLVGPFVAIADKVRDALKKD